MIYCLHSLFAAMFIDCMYKLIVNFYWIAVMFLDVGAMGYLFPCMSSSQYDGLKKVKSLKSYAISKYIFSYHWEPWK